MEWGNKRCGVYIGEADAGADSVELEAKRTEENSEERIEFKAIASAASSDYFGEQVVDGEGQGACSRVMEGCVFKGDVGAVVPDEALQVGQRGSFLWK